MLLPILALLTSSALCTPTTIDRVATVRHIIDGDTLTLQSGEKVRLIGIDTPEIDHEQPALSEPFALEAKDELRRLLAGSRTLHLRFGHKKEDKYGRLLAYVFNNEGINLGEQLLKNGLAHQFVYDDDEEFQECYSAARELARINKAGMWSSDQLFTSVGTGSKKGIRYIKAKLLKKEKGRKGLFLILDNEFKLYIPLNKLPIFMPWLDQLNNGSSIMVNGISRNGHSLTLRHTSQIIQPEPPDTRQH